MVHLDDAEATALAVAVLGHLGAHHLAGQSEHLAQLGVVHFVVQLSKIILQGPFKQQARVVRRLKFDTHSLVFLGSSTTAQIMQCTGKRSLLIGEDG